MNDDLTPPDVSLDPAAKARIRQQVLAGVQEPATERRWLVPAGAVAAVALIALVSTVVASGGDNMPELAPAGPATVTTTDEPTNEPTTEPTTDEPTTDPEPANAPAALETACRPELGIEKAEEVLTFSDDLGSAAFYSDGTRWQLCSVHGDIVTVQADETIARPSRFDSVEPYQVSTDTVVAADGTLRTSFTAGGVLYSDRDEYLSIVYTFPGGVTVPAELAEGRDGAAYWAMDYTPTDGPLADPKVNQTKLPEIEVEISYEGGFVQGFPLEWGIDTCAQVNHGC
ncbi:hypothetical protein [Nocardioides sp.]|uniref:hypothetical protein n=1 Tax=Nocardioides sp. TaxID=35761 RepID=UPI002624AC4C|nr:hypothetical protein [Nocardioides sp.]